MSIADDISGRFLTEDLEMLRLLSDEDLRYVLAELEDNGWHYAQETLHALFEKD